MKIIGLILMGVVMFSGIVMADDEPAANASCLEACEALSDAAAKTNCFAGCE